MNVISGYIGKLQQDWLKHGYEEKFKEYRGQIKQARKGVWNNWQARKGVWNNWVRPVAKLLMLIRFSILVALVFGYIFLFNDQGQEALRSLAEMKSWHQMIFFVVSAFICALTAWYWARVAFFFNFNGHDESEHLAGIREYLPRVIGSTVFFVIAVAFFTASWAYDSPFSSPGAKLNLLATVFFMLGLLFPYLAKWLRVWFRLREKDRRDHPDVLKDLPSKTGPFLLLGLAITIGLTIAFAYWAVEIAPFLGVGTIMLLFAAALIPNGTFLVLYFGARQFLPVISFLLVWAIAMSLFVDNHRVRQNGDMRSYEDFSEVHEKPGVFDDISSIPQYFHRWIAGLETAHDATEQQRGNTTPVFIVSAEGGGIRAAYWTAMVLGELQDQAEKQGVNFARHVFAISGVSGGSLGAATYAALLAQKKSDTTHGCGNGLASPDESFRHRGHRILSKDFLSPTLAVMLFPDFLQRFLPVPLLDDRAMALEKSWEAAWRECEEGDRLAQPFKSLWAESDFSVPLLFLNSTVVESGKRMITSPIPFTTIEFNNAFSDALATTQVLGHEIPLSTAVHTGARFTYVSPAGTVRRMDLDKKATESQRWIRVVDGGYFENSGAVTANEILNELERAAWRRSQKTKATGESVKPIRPIVIHISNDPIRKEKNEWARQSNRYAFMPEIFSPIQALLNVRPARGYQARSALAYRIQDNDQQTNEAEKNNGVIARPGLHFHFRLCEYGVPLPLGWMLSEETQGEMQAQLSDELAGDRDKRGIAQYNQNIIEKIIGVLSGKPEISTAARSRVETHELCKVPGTPLKTDERLESASNIAAT